jgi:uncharacterized protein (TIGR03084 family)
MAGWDALVRQAREEPLGFFDAQALAVRQTSASELLARWDRGRAALAAVLRDYPAGEKLPWYGPPMSPTSMAAARFMETWAHSLDVADALGITVEPTDRIRHVSRLGVRTRDFAFVTHKLTPSAEQFRVELVAPSGAVWSWGPEGAAQSVRGSAFDFCLLVTQRRHRDDLDLIATGAEADRWLNIAQVFAGPPGVGREPRSRMNST